MLNLNYFSFFISLWNPPRIYTWSTKVYFLVASFGNVKTLLKLLLILVVHTGSIFNDFPPKKGVGAGQNSVPG